jgi:hypothetical protein
MEGSPEHGPGTRHPMMRNRARDRIAGTRELQRVAYAISEKHGFQPTNSGYGSARDDGGQRERQRTFGIARGQRQMIAAGGIQLRRGVRPESPWQTPQRLSANCAHSDSHSICSGQKPSIFRSSTKQSDQASDVVSIASPRLVWWDASAPLVGLPRFSFSKS